jgi:hypothetical protein
MSAEAALRPALLRVAIWGASKVAEAIEQKISTLGRAAPQPLAVAPLLINDFFPRGPHL